MRAKLPFVPVSIALASIVALIILARISPRASTAQVAPPPSMRVWFAPNIGSVDFINLFTEPTRWPEARGLMRVFKFYQDQLLSLEPCSNACGPNSGQALVDAQVFPKLTAWNKEVAVEVQPLKHYICTHPPAGQTPVAYAASVSHQVIQNVGLVGGTVAYLSMDEPLSGGWQTIAGSDGQGDSCNYTLAQSATHVASYIAAIKQDYPAIRIGDIEVYPDPSLRPTPANPNLAQGSVARITDFVLALEARGIHLDFFHLDVNREAVSSWNTDLAADLPALKSFFANRPYPIRFGVIVNANDLAGYNATNNHDYYTSALTWANIIHATIGAPDDLVVQSWHEYPAGVKNLPSNLSETASFSHTRLLREVWNLFTGIGPDTESPSVSLYFPAPGATIASTITFRANASDNVAVARVEFLVNGQVIGEDASAPYTFTVDTSIVPDGAYTIAARATDTSSNVTTSAPITVTVRNTIAPPFLPPPPPPPPLPPPPPPIPIPPTTPTPPAYSLFLSPIAIGVYVFVLLIIGAALFLF